MSCKQIALVGLAALALAGAPLGCGDDGGEDPVVAELKARIAALEAANKALEKQAAAPAAADAGCAAKLAECEQRAAKCEKDPFTGPKYLTGSPGEQPQQK